LEESGAVGEFLGGQLAKGLWRILGSLKLHRIYHSRPTISTLFAAICLRIVVAEIAALRVDAAPVRRGSLRVSYFACQQSISKTNARVIIFCCQQ
jgi:hypothetical protein